MFFFYGNIFLFIYGVFLFSCWAKIEEVFFPFDEDTGKAIDGPIEDCCTSCICCQDDSQTEAELDEVASGSYGTSERNGYKGETSGNDGEEAQEIYVNYHPKKKDANDEVLDIYVSK